MTFVVLGLMLLVAAVAVFGRASRQQTRRAREFSRAAHMECAFVEARGRENPGETVAVAGRCAAGAAGSVTAPSSGRECIWYRMTVSERRDVGKWNHTDMDDIREYVIQEESAPEQITLADASGSVSVHIGRASTDHLFTTVNRIDRPTREAALAIPPPERRGHLRGIHIREEILLADMPLYVTGAAHRVDGEGVVDRPAEGEFVVSGRPHAAQARTLRRRARWLMVAAVATGLFGLLLLLIGIAILV